MAADRRITQGLELFASGDLAGAARFWLEARALGDSDPQLDVYLDHVRAVVPDVVNALETELGLAHPRPAPKPQVAVESPPSPPAPALAIPVPAPPIAAMVLAPPPPPSPESVAPISAIVLAPAVPLAVPESAVPLAVPESAAPLAVPEPAAPLAVSEPAAPLAVSEPIAAPPPVTPTPVPLAIEYSGPIEPYVEVPAPVPPPLDAVAPPLPAGGPWGGDAMLGPPMEVTSPGGGLDLVAAKGKTAEPIAVPQGELARDEAALKERLGLDDFSGALTLAERLLASNPAHPLALSARERCRANLQQIHSSKLGDLDRAPRVLIPPEQVIWLDLDHRTGFLLAQVDSISSYEDLIELSGMDRLEALRLLAQLVQKGVIGPG